MKIGDLLFGLMLVVAGFNLGQSFGTSSGGADSVLQETVYGRSVARFSAEMSAAWDKAAELAQSSEATDVHSLLSDAWDTARDASTLEMRELEQETFGGDKWDGEKAAELWKQRAAEAAEVSKL